MKSPSKSDATKIIGGLVVLAILLIGYLLVLSPRMGKPGEIKASAEQVAAATAVANAEAADLEQKQTDIAAEATIAEELSTRFPADAAQRDLFENIRKAASKADIPERDVTTVTPSVPQLGVVQGGAAVPGTPAVPAADGSTPAAPLAGTVASMQVSATVTGSYDQLVQFLGAIEDSNRSWLIDTVSLSPAEADSPEALKGKYTLTMAGATFMLPQMPVPDLDGGAAPAAPADAAPAPTAPASS